MKMKLTDANIRRAGAAGMLAFALLPLAQPALAIDWDPLSIRARVISVSPNEDSGAVNVPALGGAVAGSGVNVDEDVVAEVDFSWFFNDHWAAELIVATSTHEVSAAGATLTGLGLAKIAEAGVLPPTLTVQYHFNPEGPIRPYVGVGVNFTLFYDEKVTGGLAAPGADLDMDSSLGLAGQIGVDIDLDDHWFLNADVKYIRIGTDATITGSAVGDVSVDVDIDPFVFGIGIGYRFD